MDTQAVLDHHLAAFSAGDVDEILLDYTDESAMITSRGVVRGREALREVFGELLTGIFAPGTHEFTMDAVRVDGDVAFIAWHASCASVDIPMGSDTFVVRDGKIAAQTVAFKIDPK